MAFAVKIVPSALKELRRVEPRDVRDRLIAGIDRLAANPSPAGSLVLAGGLDLRRFRVGDWRVVYRVDIRAHEVTVLVIGHRRDVYKRLARKGR